MKVTAFTTGKDISKTAEPGLTWYITTKNQKVLIVPYDSENFWKYADLKETAVGEIDKIFLLQGCRDSIRELEHFLKNNSKAEIYLPRKNNERYLTSLYHKSQVYADNKRMKEWRSRIKFVDDFRDSSEDIEIDQGLEDAGGSPDGANQNLILSDNGVNALFVNDRKSNAESVQNRVESVGKKQFNYIFYCGEQQECMKKNCKTSESTEMQNGQTEEIAAT
jgi:metal-dependent hydrolase (beta-lactamase superfamily II)